MEIVTASFGFCMGIERAYRRIDERARAEPPFTVTHQNSANPFDTLRRIQSCESRLLEQYPGLAAVSVKLDPAAIAPGERVVLGFHGLEPEDRAVLSGRGAAVLDDLICPFIAKLDRVVERHVAAGYDVAMVGSPANHHLATARKLATRYGRRCYPIVAIEDIDRLPYADGQPIVLVGEVTGNTEIFRDVAARIAAAGLPIKVMKTMCADSYRRQHEAAVLARRADVVVLIDDGGDGARSVFEVCSTVNARVHRISAADQVDAQWFCDARVVAVVGGILIPEWTIAEVADHIRTLSNSTPQRNTPSLPTTSTPIAAKSST